MNITYGHTRRFATLSILLFLGTSLSGCATIKSGSHYDESATYDHYRTYSWIADQPLIVGAGDKPTISPLTEKKILFLVLYPDQ